MADGGVRALDPKAYRIVRTPDLDAVAPETRGELTPDALVRYELVGPRTEVLWRDAASVGRIGPAEYVRWWVYRERTTDGATDHVRVADLGPGWEKAYSWSVHPGRYLVVCRIQTTLHPEVEAVVTLPQYVMSEDDVDSILATMVGRARRAGLANPDDADRRLRHHISNLQRIAERDAAKLTPEQRTRHDNTVATLREYRRATADLLDHTHRRRRIPIAAVHIDYESQTARQLNFFLAKMSNVFDHRHAQWRLVDWTNPVKREQHSEIDGDGDTDREAIDDAFSKWDWWRGRYPRGKIQFAVDLYEYGVHIRAFYNMETDGETTWDTVIGGLQTAATVGSLVLIGVATIGAAVPIEGAATVATYATVFSATTGVGAAAIAIGQRRTEGIHDWKQDAMDVLTIIGGIFAAPERAWVKGATIVLGPSRGLKAGKYVFVGARGGLVGADATQGFLIADGLYAEYEGILNDPKLTPEERERQLREFFVKASGELLMTGFPLVSDVAEFRSVARARGLDAAQMEFNHKVEELRDPNGFIDTTKANATKGKSEDRRTKTVVNTEAPRSHRKGVGREFPAVSEPRRYGLTAEEDHALRTMTDKIIMVRAGNAVRVDLLDPNGRGAEFAGKLVAKTDDVHFKTNRNPASKYHGIVCAGPKDPEMMRFIEQHNAKVAARAPGYENRRAWTSFEEDFEGIRAEVFEETDLRIGDASEDYVVRNKDGKMLFSDVDLHGVYDRKTGNGLNTNDPALQTEINQKLGGEVIKHGGQADWSLRMDLEETGAIYGPLPPVLAYVDGKCVRLETWEDMKAFARDHNIKLEAQFPGFDFEKWVQNMKKYPSLREQAAKERAAHARALSEQSG